MIFFGSSGSVCHPHHGETDYLIASAVALLEHIDNLALSLCVVLNVHDGIVEIGKSVVGVFGQIAEFGTGKLKPMFEQVFGWAGQTLLPAMMNLFNESAPHIASLVTNIGTAVMNVAGIIASAIQALLPIIGNIVMAVVSIATTVGPPI